MKLFMVFQMMVENYILFHSASTLSHNTTIPLKNRSLGKPTYTFQWPDGTAWKFTCDRHSLETTILRNEQLFASCKKIETRPFRGQWQWTLANDNRTFLDTRYHDPWWGVRLYTPGRLRARMNSRRGTRIAHQCLHLPQ